MPRDPRTRCVERLGGSAGTARPCRMPVHTRTHLPGPGASQQAARTRPEDKRVRGTTPPRAASEGAEGGGGDPGHPSSCPPCQADPQPRTQAPPQSGGGKPGTPPPARFLTQVKGNRRLLPARHHAPAVPAGIATSGRLHGLPPPPRSRRRRRRRGGSADIYL